MLLLPLKVATFCSFLLSLTEGSIYVGPGDYTENRKFICTGGANCQQSGKNVQEFECTDGANCQRNPPQGSYIIWVPSSINQMSWRMQFSRALLIQFSDNTVLHIIWFQAVARRLPIAENVCRSREFSFLKYFLHRTGKIINIIISIGIGRSNENGKR